MKVTLLLTTLSAALVAASPASLGARPGTIRVQISDDTTDTAVQANIPANGAKTSIAANFANLGSGVPANRAFVVSGSGSCGIFKDNGSQKVATIKSGADDVTFARVKLQNGVIVCK
ncbi:uncharacterized protein N0V89_010164 [Didymosphaeria variabile]|uniref:Uncharacterized protein n=1 Tax=Didymosphaeria variabile TaxID=1932322 RepID=A0A9W8XGI1_9PLEO|nr:uncharacterized protein N0V89_010164 [Didymosphaeria variabile]KAJ4348786.1 hypothetical protein N0V89_010164 [Didymosphaeria variabile]